MLANRPLGYLEEIWAKRDAVLSTARMSAAARARAMGRPTYPGAIFYTPPAKPLQIPEASPPSARQRIIKYSVREILGAVSITWMVGIRALLGSSKSPFFSRPRFAAALLMKEEMLLSNHSIAHCFGRGSDASGWDMIKRARQLLATDLAWAERYHAAERLLKDEK